MQAEAARHAPVEACGLVAGSGGLTARVYPVANQLQSPVSYLMDPAQQLAALMEIDDQGWDLLAIYHSHPAGPATPSGSDIDQAAYPGVVHLIWYYLEDRWECNGYLIEDRQVLTVHLQVVDPPLEAFPGAHAGAT